jgi:DNA glycosylase AlkZ-like
MPMRITVDQRRARLADRHRLAPRRKAAAVEEVATSLVALHATDPATVHLAAGARLVEPSVAAVEKALYDDRTLVRMLGMRRTMFVVPRDSVPVIQAACTDAVAANQRKLLIQHLAEAGVADDPAPWLDEVGDATVRALAARGEATANDLAADEPRLRTQLKMAQGKSYAAVVNVTSRVLTILGAQGRIVRGRPRGSWISSQYRWSTIENWLPGGLTPWPAGAARTELARQWLRAFGPAPASDLRWWAGWTAGDLKRALSGLDVVEADLDGGTGLLLADDTDPVPDGPPWVALLPALDPTVMGWVDRGWFLGPHAGALFDRTGNAGPTVWYDGRVVGGWAQGAAGEVRYRLLEDVGREVDGMVARAAAELTGWLGPVRVTPRFRTPLERELAG